MNRETIEAINTIATEAIAAARLPAEDRIPGVRALDLCRDGPNGAMLFWADAEADLNGQREPVLCDVLVQRTDGAWRVAGGASCSSEPLEELLAGLAPGPHRFSGSAANRVFLTWALATPAAGADCLPGTHRAQLCGCSLLAHRPGSGRTGGHATGGRTRPHRTRHRPCATESDRVEPPTARQTRERRARQGSQSRSIATAERNQHDHRAHDLV